MSDSKPKRYEREFWIPIVVVLLAWCSAYLLLINQIAPFEQGVVDWLNVGIRSLIGSVVFVALILAIDNRWTRIGVGAVLSFATFAVLAGFWFFHAWSGTVPHSGQILHLGEIREVLPQVAHQLSSGWLVFLFFMWVIQMVAVWSVPERRLLSRRAVGLCVGLAVCVAVTHGVAARAIWDAGDRVEAKRLWVFDLNESVARFGILQGWWRDATALIERRRHPINHDWPGTLTGRPAVPEGAISKARNVILMQVESLDPWVIGHEINGNLVMPHLEKLIQRARSFPNFFAQHSGGGSSDAELAVHLGVLPLATHSGLLSADWAVARPLPAFLVGHGWSTVGLHANRASYFNRNVVYPKMGFEHFFSEPDFTGAASGWESIDSEFMIQALDFIDSVGEPFFASVITLQSHGPFRHHQSDSLYDSGPEIPRLERDYLQCMHEVDEAVGVLLRWLEAESRFDDTAVLLFGDHRSRARGPEPVGPENIPLIVMAPSIEPGLDYRVGTHVDLGPTVLDLLGLQPPSGWLGTSLLDQGPGAAIFNTLDEVKAENGVAVFVKAPERMPFLLYSATVLGQ